MRRRLLTGLMAVVLAVPLMAAGPIPVERRRATVSVTTPNEEPVPPPAAELPRAPELAVRPAPAAAMTAAPVMPAAPPPAAVAPAAAEPPEATGAGIAVSGSCWVDYWAQRQAGNVRQEVSDGAVWQPGPQPDPTASRKTFLPGFSLDVDCAPADGLTLYGEICGSGGDFTLEYAYAQAALPGALALTAGLNDVPFGYEYFGSGCGGEDDAVFISSFSPRAGAALLPAVEVGLTLSGTVADDMATWTVALLNGALPSVADSAGVTGWATPDNNDAKSAAGQLLLKPLPGMFVIGSYIAGSFNNAFVPEPTRYTAYGLGAGGVLFDRLNLSAEMAVSRHNRLMYDFGMGAGAPAGHLVAARVNEYILKATWTGLADWDLGVRCGVVDPRNIEAEVDAGFARETQTTLAARYRFMGGVQLLLEYSNIRTVLDHYRAYDAVRLGAGATALQSGDPDDDIFAAELLLDF